ncbi:MAG: DUF4861 family protein [Candidatus Latescibacter sp.]|nr:DUF4861 family protein [Candidatus Latescibacter sp.]
MKIKQIAAWCVLGLFTGAFLSYSADGWYTEGNDFIPKKRIKVILTNPVNTARPNCPVVISRKQLPDQNLPEQYITVVDPSLPSNPEPTLEQLQKVGAELIRKETNGHILEYQQDDIDHDGIWDELFFMPNLKARETKTIYLYIEFSERGLAPHKTHAGIGYYGRHIVTFWEAEYIGWKLWYPTDVDMHGKRKPMLTAYPEYQGNLGGYYMPMEMGTDIMAVANTFGAGGICLFENSVSMPDSVSRPRFTPWSDKGPIHDTRYTFDVIANGPLRSIIRVNTTNWRSGAGEYALQQTYIAYAHKSYATCDVRFTELEPVRKSVMFGCGIREIMNQYNSLHRGGMVISYGKNVNPYPPLTFSGSSIKAFRDFRVGFEAIALVVKDKYKPEYRNIKGFNGNHVFRLPVTPDLRYEYLIAGAWNEGAVNKTPEEFTKYVETETLLYNNPLKLTVGEMGKK